MDQLHETLAALHAENKSASRASLPGHLTAFRQFLAELDRAQPKPPPRPVRGKPQPRKPARRGR
jgi:hypothetical protein